MAISLIFSVSIYQLNFHEINLRLENLQKGILLPGIFPITNTSSELDQVRIEQSELASSQMIVTLFYVNLVILVGGGIGSYVLARRTLEPIERAHEAQSRFTSDASHELRTPLAAMKTELEVALRDPNINADETKELITSNLEEVNKLIQLSEMLLKLARLDYDKLEKKQLNIVELFESTLKQYSKHRKRFDITTRQKALIYGNESAILEVLSILVDNAIKYSPARSRIAVRIFEKRMMVGFEISNSGKPIPEESLPRIFDRFYRADTSRTESNKNGYGLGLAIGKKIADIHYGDIQVRSTDKLTTFTLTLPSNRNVQTKLQKTSL